MDSIQREISCDGCRILQQDLDKVRQEHETDFKMLKEKIISTDLLIKKYSAKCQECESQGKHLEEVNGKLSKAQREWETIAQQLKTALEEVEPLRKAKEKNDRRKESYSKQIEDLQDKLHSYEASQQQLTAIHKKQDDEKSKIDGENKQSKLKLKEVEASLKRAEAMIKKANDELERKRTKCKELKKQNTGLNKSKERLEARLLKCENVLQEYELLSEVGKRRKTPASSVNTETSYQEALSSGDEDEGMTIDRIFNELGVFDEKTFLMPLSPAHSPIYSPAPPDNFYDDEPVLTNTDAMYAVEEMDFQEAGGSASPRNRFKNSAKKVIRLLSSSETLLDKGLSDSDQERDGDVDVPFPSYQTIASAPPPKPLASAGVHNKTSNSLRPDKVYVPQPSTSHSSMVGGSKPTIKHINNTPSSCVLEGVEGKVPDARKSLMKRLIGKKSSQMKSKSSTGAVATNAIAVLPKDREKDKVAEKTSASVDKKTEEAIHAATVSVNVKQASVTQESVDLDEPASSEQTPAEATPPNDSHLHLVPVNCGEHKSAPERRRSFCKQDSLDLDSEVPLKTENSVSTETEAIKASPSPQNASPLDDQTSSQPASDSVPVGSDKTKEWNTKADPRHLRQPSTPPVVSFFIASESSDSSSQSPLSQKVSASPNPLDTSETSSVPPKAQDQMEEAASTSTSTSNTNDNAPESQMNADDNPDDPDDPDAHNTLTKQGSFPFSVTLNDDQGSDSDTQSKIAAMIRKKRRSSSRSSLKNSRLSLGESGIDSPKSPLSGSYGFHLDKIVAAKTHKTVSDSSVTKVRKPSLSSVVPDKKTKASQSDNNRNIECRSESVDSGMGTEGALPPQDTETGMATPILLTESSKTSWVPQLPEDAEPNLRPQSPSCRSDVSETHSIYNYVDLDDIRIGNPISPLPPSPANMLDPEDMDDVDLSSSKPANETKVKKDKKNRNKKKSKLKVKKLQLLETLPENTDQEDKLMSHERKVPSDVNGNSSDPTLESSTEVGAPNQKGPRKVIEIEPMKMAEPGRKRISRVTKRKSEDSESSGPAPKQMAQKDPDKNETAEIPPRIPTEQEIRNIDLEMHNILKHDAMYTEDVVRRLCAMTPFPPTDALAQRIIQALAKTELDLLPMWCSRLSKKFTPKDKGWLSKPEFKMLDLIKALSGYPKHKNLVEETLAAGEDFFSHGVAGRIYSVKGSATVCRVFVALCRMTGDAQRPRVLAYDLLKNKCNGYVSLIVSMTAVWPLPLTKGTESASDQPLLSVLIYGCCKCLAEENVKHQKMMMCFKSLCYWQKNSQTATEIANNLLDCVHSVAVFNKEAMFRYEKALTLLASVEGWTWTNNVLVLEIIWPILHRWVAAGDANDHKQESVVELLIRFLGSVGRLYIEGDGQSCDTVTEVMKMLTSLIYGLPNNKKVPVQIQVVALESLLFLAPFSPDVIAPCVQHWISHSSESMSSAFTKMFSVFTEHYLTTPVPDS